MSKTGSLPRPTVGPPPTDPAEEAWLASKDTTSIGVLEAFIAKFGSSFYAELARARLAELKKQKEEIQAGAFLLLDV